MVELFSQISAYMIPAIIVFIPLYAMLRKKQPVYEVFVDGAKDGFDTAIGIIPHLVGMMVAISMFRASGAMDRSEEHTSELQSRENLVCRLLLEKKKL